MCTVTVTIIGLTIFPGMTGDCAVPENIQIHSKDIPIFQKEKGGGGV